MALVWRDEIEGQVQVESSELNFELADSYSLIEDELKSSESDKKILSLFKDDNGLIQGRLGKKNQFEFKGAERKAFFPDGKVSASNKEANGGWLHWLLKLHRELLLGGSGKYLVALVGLFFIFLILSGALMIPFFKGLKGKKQFRFKISVLHQKIGALTFSWLVLITFTGVFLALNSLLIGLFLKSTLSEQRANTSENITVVEHKIKTVLDKAMTAAKGYEVDFISYPDTEFSLPGTYALLLEGKSDKKIAFVKSNIDLDTVIVDLPWYLKALVVSEPLHFGNYGGIGLKLFWTLFGLLVGIIPCTGFINYYFRVLAKRKNAV